MVLIFKKGSSGPSVFQGVSAQMVQLSSNFGFLGDTLFLVLEM